MKYDNQIPHAFSVHARKITIGAIKLQRLSMKNMRRAANGLPPRKSYAEI